MEPNKANSPTEMSPAGSRKNRRWLWLITVLGILLIAMVVMRMRDVKNVARQDVMPWALEHVKVGQGIVTQGFPVLATVTTEGEITVTGQIAGTILKMGPREGISVKAGDLLARIDTREIEDNIAGTAAKLTAAQAEVTRRDNELKREQKLFEEGGSSETSLETYRTAAIAAQNNVRALEHQISAMNVRAEYGMVVAPADGVISARLREPGDVCMVGHPIYKMTVSRGARIRVRIPQSVVEEMSPGTPLELYHGSDTLRVSLNRIYPSLDAMALGAAEADLKTPPFGMSSGARIAGRIILKQSSLSTQVPPEALIMQPGAQTGKLFKVVHQENGSHLKEMVVGIGIAGRNNVSIHGDLSPGDDVIVGHESVLLQLKDGDPVIVNEGGAS